MLSGPWSTYDPRRGSSHRQSIYTRPMSGSHCESCCTSSICSPPRDELHVEPFRTCRISRSRLPSHGLLRESCHTWRICSQSSGGWLIDSCHTSNTSRSPWSSRGFRRESCRTPSTCSVANCGTQERISNSLFASPHSKPPLVPFILETRSSAFHTRRHFSLSVERCS